jgi:hypothetical protein
MKKINAMLQNPDVQGVILVTVIFTALIIATVLTWGK